MKKIESMEDLQQIQDEANREMQRKTSRGEIEVVVSLGSCGIAVGALDVLHIVEEEINAHDLKDVTVSQTGCMGLCKHEPILQVIVGNTSKVTYGKVVPDVAKRIIREHIIEGGVVEEYIVDASLFPTI